MILQILRCLAPGLMVVDHQAAAVQLSLSVANILAMMLTPVSPLLAIATISVLVAADTDLLLHMSVINILITTGTETRRPEDTTSQETEPDLQTQEDMPR